jgi:hypothetical protein
MSRQELALISTLEAMSLSPEEKILRSKELNKLRQQKFRE